MQTMDRFAIVFRRIVAGRQGRTRLPRSWAKALRVTAGVFVIVAFGASAALAAGSNTGIGFDTRAVQGFPTGAVSLSGGGSFDPATGFVRAGGGFSCTSSVGQGQLTGCLAGQGVRWDTAALLSSSPFKCTGALTEALKTATTDRETLVIQADFYRAGDANDESFTAAMIVSTRDLAPDISGIQNVWVQGVGCGAAVVHTGS